MPLSEHEWAVLERACAAVPPPAVLPTPLNYQDYARNLVQTVLDLNLRRAIVDRALVHYDAHRRDEIRTLEDVEVVLARFEDDAAGNRAAANHLWGYNYARRVSRLRSLVRWVRQRGLIDQASLSAWAHSSTFSRDFAGEMKGLGFNAYQWLVMRLGVDTVKPDVWLHRFIRRVLGRGLTDHELVVVLTEAAHRVGRSARELDAGIWASEPDVFRARLGR